MKIEFEVDRLGKCEWELPPSMVERLDEATSEERAALLEAIRDEVQGHLHIIAGALLCARVVPAFRSIANNRRDLSDKLKRFMR